MPPRSLTFALAAVSLAGSAALAADAALSSAVAAKLSTDYASLDALYRDFHTHPELSLMEERTAGVVARELRATGCDVTERVGGFGVVGVLKNGDGPTLLIRTDLDALPVQEETGLPYASKVRVKDLAGNDVPVMHACGHDIHLACLIGTARTLAALKANWAGTVVFIGQPAEERGVGARAMLKDGLYRRFPQPDFALALHDCVSLPIGTVGLIAGAAMANVDMVDITVRGIGGHGAAPHATKDPIVLAARIVVALQTIVSRETRPVDPAVVTVGSIHGGTKHNIIPDEVKLQLTLRSYSDAVRAHTLEAVRRICRGEAIAAGLPEDKLPLVVVADEGTPSLHNDPELTRRLRGVFSQWLGAAQVRTMEPEMVGEDFAEFGRTAEKVPLCLFRIGAVAPEKLAESARTGV